MKDDPEFPDDLAWNLERTLELLKDKNYVRKLRSAQEECGEAQGLIITEDIQVEGTNLTYQKTGMGDNVILCLPDALSCCQLDWQLQMERINPMFFTMIAFDPPGYGNNRTGATPKFDDTTRKRNAATAAHLMKALGFEQYSIWGLGEGARLGLQMAADFTNSVRNLMLVDTHLQVYKPLYHYFNDTEDVANIEHHDYTQLISVYDKKYLEQTWADYRLYMITAYEVYFGVLLKSDLLTKVTQPVAVINGTDAIFDYELDLASVKEKLVKGKHATHADCASLVQIKDDRWFRRIAEEFTMFSDQKKFLGIEYD